ncbi:MAG TPA: substrate-binding domain-containing protein [Syntrophobacteraceae bacterium]|nr:substrate-binding domain-containing protein [Syntrophobacteraceae bacterium]
MEPANERLICNVKSIRKARGLSQTQLAKLVGVQRQAIYDMESGRYMPNTSVALRLARHLQCKVEDLFSVEEPDLVQPVTLVGPAVQTGSRLRLGRVRNRLVGFPLDGKEMLNDALLSADGLLDPQSGRIRLFQSASRLDRTALLLGCDPAFSILSAHVERQTREARVVCRFSSSFRALEGVASGIAHVGGTHLHNSRQGEANLLLAQSALADTRATLLAFSFFEEGLMVAAGNPLGIKSVGDLAGKDVRFVNREEGAALRILLDEHLARAGVRTESIRGYNHLVSNHTQGALMVVYGLADAALGLRAVAAAHGLDFVPIEAVRCDLVVPVDLMDHPAVALILDVLQTRSFREELASLPGYESSCTGKVVGNT